MSKIKSLDELFLEELKDLYSAENQLIRALPKIANATAQTHASLLGYNRVRELLQETLGEEKAANHKLNQIAEDSVNDEANQRKS